MKICTIWRGFSYSCALCFPVGLQVLLYFEFFNFLLTWKRYSKVCIYFCILSWLVQHAFVEVEKFQNLISEDILHDLRSDQIYVMQNFQTLRISWFVPNFPGGFMISYDSQWLRGVRNWKEFTLSWPDSFLSMLLWSNNTYYPYFLGHS